jgi:hypothetical protein
MPRIRSTVDLENHSDDVVAASHRSKDSSGVWNRASLAFIAGANTCDRDKVTFKGSKAYNGFFRETALYKGEEALRWKRRKLRTTLTRQHTSPQNDYD